MKQENGNEKKSFSIQVPKELDELIEKDAAENQRSKNGQVNFILQNHYERIEAEKENVVS